MLIEPLAHFGEFGQEDEVEEIDIEGAGADVLESPSYACLLGEAVLVMTEIHDHDEHEGVHREGLGQVRPLVLDEVPPEDVGTAEKGEHHRDEEEASGIEEPLDTWPEAVGDVAEQEEVHELHGLIEGAVHHKVGLVPFAQGVGQEEGDVCPQADDPQDDDGGVFGAFAEALEEGCHHVVDEEHLEEHPSEPVAVFGGCLHGTHPPHIEGVGGAQHDEDAEEDQCGQYLHLDFLPREGSKALGCPEPVCLICQEAADEEEQRHAEKHEEGEGGGYLLRLHKPRLRHVVGDDEYHGEATHGIEPL